MTALNFPDSPAAGDIYDAPNGVQYQYDGISWNVVSAAAGVPGPQGEIGPAGPQGELGPVGPEGADGISVRYMGRVNNYTELEAIRPGAKGGQFYITNDTGEGYFALAIDDPNVVTAWEFMGRLVGQDGAVGPEGPAGVDGVEGPEGPQGIPGLGLRFVARVPTVADLPATATQGDIYIVEATGDGHVWDETVPGFVNAGPIVGPTGSQGATGPQGEAGVQGPAGADGVDGKDGLPGKQGDVGPQGEQGIQGETGPAGADGAQGIQGEVGPVGPKGDQGVPGEVGAEGPVGPVGPQGEAGIQGVQGEPGPAGAQGEAGPAGVDGVEGPEGPQGVPGLGLRFVARVATVGDLPATATQGDVYLIEETGDAHVWDETIPGFVNAGPIVGPTGAQGPTGPQGEAGPAGADGAEGPQGIPGPTAVSADAGNISKLGTDGLLFTPESSYALPIASATRLGGVKIGTGMSVTADGTISTTASTNYVNKSGDVMNGPLRYANSGGVSSFNGQDVYTYYDGTYFRVQLPGGKSGYTIEIATGKVTFSIAPKCTFAPVDGSDLTNKSYVDSAVSSSTAFLKTTGGTMTGGITLPTTVQSLTWGTSTYNIFGANGGVAVRYGNANIVNFTATGASFTQKITTPGTGIGVEFGSSGAYMSKVGTGIGVYAGGQQRWTFDSTKHKSLVPIELPADPVNALEAAPKQYVDTKPTIVSMPAGGTAPDASLYPNNTLLVEYSA